MKLVPGIFAYIKSKLDDTLPIVSCTSIKITIVNASKKISPEDRQKDRQKDTAAYNAIRKEIYMPFDHKIRDIKDDLLKKFFKPFFRSKGKGLTDKLVAIKGYASIIKDLNAISFEE